MNFIMVGKLSAKIGTKATPSKCRVKYALHARQELKERERNTSIKYSIKRSKSKEKVN